MTGTDRPDNLIAITEDQFDLLIAMFGYPYSPATAAELAGEVLWRDGHAASGELKRLEQLGLVARVPASKPVLWYLPGEEPYVVDGRQLTDAEEDAVLARLEDAVGPAFGGQFEGIRRSLERTRLDRDKPKPPRPPKTLLQRLWPRMHSRSTYLRATRETKHLLTQLRAHGLTQRQAAALMGGPAAFHRFCEIARGKRLPDMWERGRLREVVGELTSTNRDRK